MLGKAICEVGFGDGRNLNLFGHLGMKVSGVEPDLEVVNFTQSKFKEEGIDFDLYPIPSTVTKF